MSAYGLAQNWWVIVLRGTFAVLFGLAALLWPTLTQTTIVFLIGLYLLADGVLSVIAGLTHANGSRPWWLLLVEGLLGIVAGALILLTPGLTAITLLYLIATWAILTGMVEIVSAIRLRAEIDNEGLLALSGVLSVTLGILLMIWPAADALAIVRLSGAYALAFGLLLIALGFRLWNWQHSAHQVLRPARVEAGQLPRQPREK